jgi:hypothetical protein
MRKFVILVGLFLCLPICPVQASDPAPFQLIYRQENIVSSTKWANTTSDLMITIINLSGGEARDIVLSIPGPNPYLFVDSPVSAPTIPTGRQAEILHESKMPNDLIALADPEDKLLWRIEYTNEAGARISVEIPGVKAN